jgi:hypothetical protein
LKYDGLPKRIKEEFNKYLTERGIDGALAQSVSEFIKYKTQKVSTHNYFMLALFIYFSRRLKDGLMLSGVSFPVVDCSFSLLALE